MSLQAYEDFTDFQILAGIRSLVEPGVAIALNDPTAPRSALYPEEAACLPPMRALRRREFLAGRDALRRAMSHVGIAPSAIPVREDRSPALPAGVCASLSHSATMCVAIADLDKRTAALGIDIEPIDGLDLALWDTVCVRSERQWLNEQPALDRPLLAKQIFCAKEAAYKCQFTLSNALVDFDIFEITFLSGSQFYATFRGAVGPFTAGDRIFGHIGEIADHYVAVTQIRA